jgi:UDP-N-acetylmuramate: L-alanyl-gamma-D-glutamyl-meso-diaminopimelate ligase
MHIHILGICGTFMGGLARLALDSGIKVTGSDVNAYPPMSTQLEGLGVEIIKGYETCLDGHIPDLVLIGNTLSRDNPAIEHVLDNDIPYMSGPEWIAQNFLQKNKVIAVAGTHGKTTTASMIAWILEYSNLEPSFLIGGVPLNFNVSARQSSGQVFVIEADEYDTAFFDKRSKFIHYKPDILVLNNIEYDHADIFNDLDDIKVQFHHLIKTIPKKSIIVFNLDDENIKSVLKMGHWSKLDSFSSKGGENWSISIAPKNFCNITQDSKLVSKFQLKQFGEHNATNALAAIAAAYNIGVPVEQSARALEHFLGTSRRMQLRFDQKGVKIYDDFAHHPTAIKASIQAVRHQWPEKRLFVITELRSNSMRMGAHKDKLAEALKDADQVFLKDNIAEWNVPEYLTSIAKKVSFHESSQSIVNELRTKMQGDEVLLVMSNGPFDDICSLIIDTLSNNE